MGLANPGVSEISLNFPSSAQGASVVPSDRRVPNVLVRMAYGGVRSNGPLKDSGQPQFGDTSEMSSLARAQIDLPHPPLRRRRSGAPELTFRSLDSGTKSPTVTGTAPSIDPANEAPLILSRQEAPASAPYDLPAAPPMPAPASPARGLGEDTETKSNTAERDREGAIDEIVDRAWQALMLRLSIEQERRGFGRWA
jgi:hypothetical protein